MAKIARSSEREGVVYESKTSVPTVVAEVGCVAVLLANKRVPESGGMGLCTRVLENHMVRLTVTPVDEHAGSDSGQIAQDRGWDHLLALAPESVCQTPSGNLMSYRLIRILAVGGAGVWVLVGKGLENGLSA